MKSTQKGILFAVALLMATSQVVAMQQPKQPEKAVDTTKQERKYGCGSWGSMLTRPRNVILATTAALGTWLAWSKGNRDKAQTFVNENRTNLIYAGLASAAGYLGWRWYTNTPQAALEPALDMHVGAAHDGCNHDHAGQKQPNNGKEPQGPQWALHLDALITQLKANNPKAEAARYFEYLKVGVQQGPHELLENPQFMKELAHKEQKQYFLDILRAFRQANTVQFLQQLVGPKDEFLKNYCIQNLQTLLENPDHLKSQASVMTKLNAQQIELYQANLAILHYYMGQEAGFMVNNDLK